MFPTLAVGCRKNMDVLALLVPKARKFKLGQREESLVGVELGETGRNHHHLL